MSSKMASGLMSQFSKHKNTILIVIGVIVVIGAIYMLASMKSKEGFTGEEGLLGMTEKLTVGPNEVVVAFFKWKDCGHCKTFAPVWSKLYTALNGTKANGKTVRMVVVDRDHPMTDKADISGFPTIRKYTTTDNYVEHEGPRDAASVTKFIKG
jgi:thiol-disulfide isomerase/thioredoxin